jgi:hypothetical protein
MPKAYEAVRDSLAKKMSYDEAQKRAAMWWNKHHVNKNPWLHEKKRKR